MEGSQQSSMSVGQGKDQCLRNNPLVLNGPSCGYMMLGTRKAGDLDSTPISSLKWIEIIASLFWL